jgi:hypothetical protein
MNEMFVKCGEEFLGEYYKVLGLPTRQELK